MQTKIKLILYICIAFLSLAGFVNRAQATNNVFLSVGQTNNDHKTGSPTITISGYTATLSVGQTATNMGVGDVITYTGGSCYISSKTSSTVWNCTNVTGGTVAQVSAVSVTSIAHVFTSLSAAVNTTTGAGGASYLGNTNLTTLDVTLNLPCYYDGQADTTSVTLAGYTTDATRYIKIYTPNNTSTEVNSSQRHSGTWTASAYQLATTGNSVNALEVNMGNVRVDGLQLSVSTASAAALTYPYVATLGTGVGNLYVSNSIMKSINVKAGSGIRFASAGTINVYVWNNTIYDFNATAASRGIDNSADATITAYAYNNTIVYCTEGMRKGSGGFTAKNNIVQNTTTGYVGTYTAGTTNNLSDHDDAPGDNPQNSKTVSFIDSANDNFHIATTDTVAKNIAIDLSAENSTFLNLLTTDIDNQTRPTGASTWDIGADESLVSVYYSVGQNTANLMSPTAPTTLTIDEYGNGTLSVGQSAPNIGVGDYIEYGTSPYLKAYISAKTNADGAHWTVQAANGSFLGVATTEPVNSIKHTFSTLSAAEAGAPGASYINNSNLVAAGVVLNIPCYYDSAADSTALTIAGYTTDSARYIKIYTPTSTTSEVNNSQRHQGKWDDAKYSLNNADPITIQVNYARIEGLQIGVTASSGGHVGIYGSGQAASNDIYASKNIVKADYSGTAWGYGIGIADDDVIFKISNNIVYNFKNANGSGNSSGMSLRGTDYVYANTVYNCYYGISRGAGTVVAKNNISSGSTFDYVSSFDGSSANNISKDATSPNSGATDCSGHYCTNQTVVFADAAGNDFRLGASDTSARNSGADLALDAAIAITTDIDDKSRPTGSYVVDIGADEGASVIFRSVGPGATSPVATTSTGGTLSISGIVATFTTAPGTTVGVGDAIQYDSDNNGSIDSIAFIIYRTNSTHYNLQKADGSAPTATSASDADWGIYRAYISLANAESGTENTGLSDTVEQFDTAWSAAGGKDIATSNELWNIACYANGGAADTTAVTVSGWTTAQLNYFRVYTPTAATEVGISQRHAGKWDNGKYALSITGAVNLVISVNYLHLDGLQVNTDFSNNTLTQSVNVTNINSSSSLVKISNNIVTYSNSPGACRGIFINDSQVNANINNNIIYSSSGDIGNGIEFLSSVSGNQYVYNNTISGVYTAFIGKVSSADNLVLKNNIAQCTDTSCYWYSFGTSSTNNLSNRASNAPGQNPQDSKTVSFVDSANKDFHLATSDTAAKNSGADLSADTNLAFSTDIDGETRKERWDIGADEDNNLTVEIKRGVNFKPGAKFK